MKKSKLTLTKEIKAVRKTFKEAKTKNTEALRQLVGSIRLLIKDNDMVSSISWTQYTPYFNDGDACEFSVNEILLKLTERGSKFMDVNHIQSWRYPIKWNTEDEYSLYSVKDALEHSTDIMNFEGLTDTINLIGTLEKVETFLHDSSDELRIAFGDHAKIVVDDGGIAVEAYEHD